LTIREGTTSTLKLGAEISYWISLFCNIVFFVFESAMQKNYSNKFESAKHSFA